MQKIGIGVDYSNICKNYNTVYLDRDNADPDTKKCMKQVMAWTHMFVSALLETFEFSTYNFTSGSTATVDTIASKRFLFYSLEKEITLQSYVCNKAHIEYGSFESWEKEEEESVLIQNDEDGGALYFYFNEASPVHEWILSQLKDFSCDIVPFEAQ